MKEIKDVESKLVNDPVKFKIYQKYELFRKQLNIYNRYQYASRISNLIKVVDPVMFLDKLFKDEGLKGKVSIQEFREFKNILEETQSENPDVDLNDITSRDTRAVVSDIISRTQPGKELVPADLDFVGVIKGYGLYKSMKEIEEGKDRATILKKNGVTEEMYEKVETRKSKYDKQGTEELYNYRKKDKVDELVHITAGVLEIAPGEAETDLKMFEIIKGKQKNNDFDTRYQIKPEEVSNLRIDLIIMNPNIMNEQKKALLDEEYNKVEERNKYHQEAEKKYRKLHGKPSPRYVRQLKEASMEEIHDMGEIG